MGLTRKPLNLSKQISLQPGTLVEIMGNSQLAASNRLLGRPSRYEGKIAILDFCKYGRTSATLGFQIIILLSFQLRQINACS